MTWHGVKFLRQEPRGLASENARHLNGQRLVMGAIPGLVEVKLLVEALFCQVGKHQDPPAQEWLSVGVISGGRWKCAVLFDVDLHGHRDLLQVVCAHRTARWLDAF